MKKSPVYLSNSRPKFTPFEINCGKIPAYRYKGNLSSELKAKTITTTKMTIEQWMQRYDGSLVDQLAFLQDRHKPPAHLYLVGLHSS